MLEVKHNIGSLGGGSGGGSSGVTLQDVATLIRNHNENLESHAKKTYKEDITTLSNTWTIQHNLNVEWNELTIIATETDGTYIVGEVDKENSTNNLLIIKFEKLTAGKVVVKK